MKAPLSSFIASVIVALVCLLPRATVFAQPKDNFGKEFYIAFGENQGGTEDENSMQLYITSQTNTKGHVEVPALGFSRDFTASPGQITTIDLPSGDATFGQPTVEITQDEELLHGMAVHVTADDRIAVYGMNHKQWSSDAFLAFPVDVVGTEYLTMNYQSIVYMGGGSTPGEFWVVAVNDSTNVTITPNARTSKGIPAKGTIQLLMNKGDVYMVQGVRSDSKNDLTGSLIESDEPIAVFSGHVRAAIPYNAKNQGSSTGSRDHLVEQLPPTSAWGDSALVVRYASSSLADLVRVVSAEDDNVITVNGTTVATLQKGQFYEITQLNGPVSIQGTSPILVGQFMHTSLYGTQGNGQPYGDPALSLVYPVEQFGNAYTFVSVINDAFTGNYVNVITDATGISGVALDGTAIPSSKFSQIPNSNFYAAQLNLGDKTITPIPGQGTHNITGARPIGITVYGLGPVDSYSYPGGTLMKTITPFKTIALVIDFGDRLLKRPISGTTPQLYSDYYDSVVSLQNVSSDPLTITGWNVRGDTNFAVPSPLNAVVEAAKSVPMRIRFTPGIPNVRQHAVLRAKTEHLTAYVVDVYGRGIIDNMQVFSDSSARIPVDTLDFGIFQNSDLPKDSSIFLSNKGEAVVTVTNATISGDPVDFTMISTDIAGVNQTIPYDIQVSGTPAHQVLRFTPNATMPNGTYQALLELTPISGASHKVVLLAHILTINPETFSAKPFDSMLLCTDQDKAVTVTNPNDFEVTITDASLSGPDASEFTILGTAPFKIAPHSSLNVLVRCSPSAPGTFSAQLNLAFDLPKGFSISQPLSVVTSQLKATFWASGNAHMLANEEMLYPIYAKTPMEMFQSSSFKLTLSYDPTHLEDIDYVQDNTHTSLCGYLVTGDSAGYREYDAYTLDGSVISGGGPNDTIPIIYIKFRSHLNDGEDQFSTTQAIPINYTINFDRGPFPSACILQSATNGMITLDTTCSNVSLHRDPAIPLEADIAFISPNPITQRSTDVTFYTPAEGDTKLVVIDRLGNVVKTLVNDVKKPGAYTVNWNVDDMPAGMYFLRLQTAGVVKNRAAIVVH
ncbi:MAG: choice-of-anchor D domain-containing protein [Bacteroidetes bacterium]|nr:choice-of-anchor D domain-containing protein [Bacteroidota bacterium]